METQAQQELEKKALDQLLSGVCFFGKVGAFAPMFKIFIEKTLKANANLSNPLRKVFTL